jgi:hypothetical protein
MEDFISEKFFIEEDRECWSCGKKFHGSRIICGDPKCVSRWQARCDEYYRKNPVSYPKGLVFYLDQSDDDKNAG